jgi:predicted AAA+ superfamily ATPase
MLLTKEKKYHFLDPFIARACAFWTGLKWEEGNLVEGVVAEHMRRLALLEGYEYGYYKDSKREIDVVLYDPKTNQTLPIEVKWQERISASDFSPLYRFGHGILATKNHFEVHREKYLAIPIPLLLANLGLEPMQKMRIK